MSRSWRSWATPRGTLRSLTRPLDTARMHCHSTRPISMISSLSGAMRYGSYSSSHRTFSTTHTIQVIELDSLSHTGYGGKHAVLHGMGRHSQAFETFGVMPSKLEQSPDPQIRGKLVCPYCRQQSFDLSCTELRHQHSRRNCHNSKCGPAEYPPHATCAHR